MIHKNINAKINMFISIIYRIRHTSLCRRLTGNDSFYKNNSDYIKFSQQSMKIKITVYNKPLQKRKSGGEKRIVE